MSPEPVEPSAEPSAERAESAAVFTEVEGVDYIVDYYAVLGLERGTDAAAVKAALRKQRSQYHPDRLVKAAPELQAAARDKMDLFAKAEQVLLAEGRERYDELLAGFDPDLVSANGLAIISVDRRRVVPDALVLGATPDQSDMVPRAEQLLGFDEAKLAELKALYEADPDNATIRKLYRDELNNKVGIMSIGEGAAWAGAGVINQDVMAGQRMLPSPEQYVETVRETVAAVRDEELGRELVRHRLALTAGVGEQRLLTASGADAEGIDDDHLERLVASAQEAFDRESAAVIEAAERTQEAIAELVALTEFEYVSRGGEDEPVEIALFHDGELLTGFRATYDVENRSLGLDPVGHPESISSIDDLRAAGRPGTVIAVTRNPNVPSLLMEITFAVETHFGIRTRFEPRRP